MERLARHKPKLIIAGASAYSLVIDWKRFREIADSTGALMVDMAHYAGLVAAGLYPARSSTPTSPPAPLTRLCAVRAGLILSPRAREALNSSIFPGGQGGPLMHVIAAKAVAFKEAMSHEFKRYQELTLDNARVMAKVLQKRGLRIVSGRTESHMFLVDLRPKKITGKEAEAVLGRAHMTVNKNAIPNDPEKPFVTSGIRLRLTRHHHARPRRTGDRGVGQPAGRWPDRRAGRRRNIDRVAEQNFSPLQAVSGVRVGVMGFPCRLCSSVVGVHSAEPTMPGGGSRVSEEGRSHSPPRCARMRQALYDI